MGTHNPAGPHFFRVFDRQTAYFFFFVFSFGKIFRSYSWYDTGGSVRLILFFAALVGVIVGSSLYGYGSSSFIPALVRSKSPATAPSHAQFTIDGASNYQNVSADTGKGFSREGFKVGEYFNIDNESMELRDLSDNPFPEQGASQIQSWESIRYFNSSQSSVGHRNLPRRSCGR